MCCVLHLLIEQTKTQSDAADVKACAPRLTCAARARAGAEEALGRGQEQQDDYGPGAAAVWDGMRLTDSWHARAQELKKQLDVDKSDKTVKDLVLLLFKTAHISLYAPD